MSKPAARMGDMTAHGGTITVGNPTVLIGGMAAARLGDMHACPLATPALPPIPHVGGPIVLGSTGVLIGGQPAARVGDMLTCVGPPDTIAMGCFTVLIGETCPGAGAGAAGGASGSAGGDSGSSAGGSSGGESGDSSGDEEEEDTGSFLDVKVVDSGGHPVANANYKLKNSGNQETGVVGGKIRKDGIDPGSYELEIKAITNTKWSTDEANVNDELTLTAELTGFESDDKATFRIFMRSFGGGDKLVKLIEDVAVTGNKTETKWQFEYPEGEDDPGLGHEARENYSFPQFYFIVNIEAASARSGLVKLYDDLEIELKDDAGDPIADEPYAVYLATGEVRRGKLDDKGKAEEKKVPVAQNRVEFPNMVDVNKLPPSND